MWLVGVVYALELIFKRLEPMQTYCAFCDKSTKFGTHVDDYMTNKSGYGGILDLTFLASLTPVHVLVQV